MKTVIIIQARYGSRRLPGKVLMDLAGKPVLQRVIERCKRAKRASQVILAIPDDEGEELGEALWWQARNATERPQTMRRQIISCVSRQTARW